MAESGFWIFETAIGDCGIAWSRDGVTRLTLPEASVRALRDRFDGLVLREPPARVARVVKRVCAHLAGKADSFTDVTLDLSGVPPFFGRVYEAARRIPSGHTATYGEIAKQLGKPGAARAVGQALGRNPVGLIVPCHRVVASGKKPGGFSAHGGLATKGRMLAIEGASL